MKPYKYFATRLGNTVIIRRTLKGLDKVTSRLYNPTKGFDIVQVSFVGGIPVASLPYSLFAMRTGVTIRDNDAKQMAKEVYTSIKPYCAKGR